MQIRDNFVRKLIFKGRITGIGRLAKAKSVKILTARRLSVDSTPVGVTR